jgi:hypothetical protein
MIPGYFYFYPVFACFTYIIENNLWQIFYSDFFIRLKTRVPLNVRGFFNDIDLVLIISNSTKKSKLYRIWYSTYPFNGV